MDRWVGKVAVVTGASAGLGESIAENLVKAGMQVVGLARRAEKIETNAQKLTQYKGKLFAFKCDMTSEEDILNAFKWITEHVGNVHVLINNAGVFLGTNLQDSVTAEWRTMFDTNVIGLSIATQEASKIMLANDIQGHIINVNSAAGHKMGMFIPELSMYSATKFAVTSLSDSLKHEFVKLGSKIKVTNISPGFVTTDVVSPEDYARYDKEFQNIVTLYPVMQSQDISDAVLYVLGTPPTVNINQLTITGTGVPY